MGILGQYHLVSQFQAAQAGRLDTAMCDQTACNDRINLVILQQLMQSCLLKGISKQLGNEKVVFLRLDLVVELPFAGTFFQECIIFVLDVNYGGFFLVSRCRQEIDLFQDFFSLINWRRAFK